MASLALQPIGSGHLWRPDAAASFEERRAGRSAYVAAASVVAFTDGVSSQQKQDLLNSTLLAQLAANRRHDRERDMIGWYGTYREVLRQVGWCIERPGARVVDAPSSAMSSGMAPVVGLVRPQLPPPRFLRVVAPATRFTADAQVLELIRSRVEEATWNTTQAALRAFAQLDDRDRRVVMFESSSHSATRGNFQIVAVEVGSDGTLRMTVVALFFSATERVSRALSFPFGSRDTQMTQVRDAMSLDAAVYDTVRDAVVQQLGDQACVAIDQLELG